MSTEQLPEQPSDSILYDYAGHTPSVSGSVYLADVAKGKSGYIACPKEMSLSTKASDTVCTGREHGLIKDKRVQISPMTLTQVIRQRVGIDVPINVSFVSESNDGRYEVQFVSRADSS